MKFRPTIASRARDVAWNWKRGRDSQGRPFRSLTGKAYLPAETPQTVASPDATKGEATDSKLPVADASSAAGQSPVGSSRCDDQTAKRAVPTTAKLGLRYER